jgi:hypothetical protein
VAGRIFHRVRAAARETTRPLPAFAGLIADVARSRTDLLMENALLRQQLIVASRKVKRPIFKAHERGFVVLLASLLPQWRKALLLVKPETVLRWHREGFRLFWRWKSNNTKRRTSRVDSEVIALIHQMAAENATWGAERIRGELLKLGIRVAKRTIQRHMTKARPPDLPRDQSPRSSRRPCLVGFTMTIALLRDDADLQSSQDNPRCSAARNPSTGVTAAWLVALFGGLTYPATQHSPRASVDNPGDV